MPAGSYEAGDTKQMRNRRILVLAALAAGLAGPAMAADATMTATADFLGADGQSLGKAQLRETPHGVLIHVDVHGLPPGAHAFHIHETGQCDAAGGFNSAGGHFNPSGHQHGVDAAEGMHAGDLLNQYVAADGRLQADLLDHEVTLGPGPNSLFKSGGTALVIHAKPDDYKTQPTGDAGGRLACAVIQKS